LGLFGQAGGTENRRVPALKEQDWEPSIQGKHERVTMGAKRGGRRRAWRGKKQWPEAEHREFD